MKLRSFFSFGPYFSFLLLAQMFESFNKQHALRSTLSSDTLRPQHNLLCSLSLFPENPPCLL